YEHAKTMNELFDEFEQKSNRLFALDEQKMSFDSDQKRVAQAEKAALITAYEEQVNQTIRDEQEKQTELERQKHTYKEIENALHEAQSAYQQEEAKTEERTQIEQQLRRYDDLWPKVEALDGKKRYIQELSTVFDKKTKEYRTLDDQLRKAEEDRDANQKKI